MSQPPVSSFSSGRTTFHVPPDAPIIVIQRMFDAPRARVFAACTRPELVARWWGPNGSSLTECQMDVRVGGRWRCVVRMPDGSEHGFGGEYREIVPDTRVVQTFRYDGFPDAVSVETMELTDEGGRTRMTTTVRHSSLANRDGHVASGMADGAAQTWDRLAEQIVRMGPLHELTLTRVFAAPPERVFRAWTVPDLFRRWFGPRDVAMPTCELDARPGGTLRFCHVVPDGTTLWIHGTFREVTPSSRVAFDTVFTDAAGRPTPFAFVPGWPSDGVMTTVATFTAFEGGTHVAVHQAVFSADTTAGAAVARERAMAAEGWLPTLERLGELVQGAEGT